MKDGERGGRVREEEKGKERKKKREGEGWVKKD